MFFSQIDPFIRFAETIHYESAGEPVYVRDCRLFYILSGQAQIRIGQQHFELHPHAVFYCCGGSRYCISSSGVDLISLNFDLSQVHSHRELPYSPVPVSGTATFPPANTVSVADQCALNHYIFLENGIICKELLEEILDEFSTRRILFREKAGAHLKTLLVYLLRGSAETAPQGARAVKRILDHISAHYDQPLTNAQLSQLTGYHEYYLNRLFVKHTGTTIHQYMLDVRISHAKKMLLNTDLPLSAIAEKAGFNSNTYFSTYFQQKVGISPAQFRKKYRNSI